MSIDKSLRTRGALERHRSVLTRAERIEQLEEDERWTDEESVLGIPKVRNLRVKRSKGRPEKEEGAEGAEAAPAAEGEIEAEGRPE